MISKKASQFTKAWYIIIFFESLIHPFSFSSSKNLLFFEFYASSKQIFGYSKYFCGRNQYYDVRKNQFNFFWSYRKFGQ